MKIAFYTLGCKVNQYETQIIRDAFTKKGFTISKENEKADVYIVNSCAVTAFADKKSRQQVRRCKKISPDSVVVLTGCFPQAFADSAKQLTQADIVCGTKDKSKIPLLVENFIKNKQRIFDISEHPVGEDFEQMQSDTYFEKTRAFVKIEDGCDRYCSYCIIPKARGHVRSKPLEDLKHELLAVSENGYKEVVLVGINLACYGKDLGLKLTDAVKLACDIDGIERVRLGSFEPEMLTNDDIVLLSKLPKFCPQFHISLQSGCDDTLKRMHRHYNSEEYGEIVNNIRKAFKQSAITTDLMVGFPGETEEEFQQSLNFAENMNFAKIHVFPYSIRKGTAAEKMEGHLPQNIKFERAHIAQEMADKSHQKYLKTKIGQTVSVLIEKYKDNSFYFGYTPDYIPVKVFSKNFNPSLPNSVIYVKIINNDDEYCIGEFEDAVLQSLC